MSDTRLPLEQVFTPGGNPSITYVGREHLNLEARVRAAVERPNRFTVISGSTKSGKSVLARRVLGERKPIAVECGQISGHDEFWVHVAYKLNIPNSATKSKSTTFTLSGLIDLALDITSMVRTKISGGATGAQQKTISANYTNVLPLNAIKELISRNTPLLIEDFHYLEKDAQLRIIRTLKSAVQEGLKVIILAVPHRTFDPVEVESEVEGRVDYVHIPNWALDDLLRISDVGFSALQVDVPRQLQRKIADDGFGNPHLVQEICYLLGAELTAPHRDRTAQKEDLARVYDRLVEGNGLNRFERISKPSIGDAPRRELALAGGGQEDMNMVILTAVARLGPEPITTYADLRESMSVLMDGKPPAEDDVARALSDMAQIAAERGRAALEWVPARRTLALTDPFLMFYLRWVLRDRRAIHLPVSAVEAASKTESEEMIEEHGDPKQ